ncbi:hypothetical protein HU200_047902 [Digitaria exilis]|uniref:Uncharacterized protein n=1 Tax=Digitaria exilis TaxID=1010633 RepID=A0A835AYI0_9POAL|nr:hypothetical protein HU200_047902 [Digitaria exilis]
MLRQRGYGQYPYVEDAHGPIPPDLSVPNCCYGVPAEVKQSRHPKTAGRAYYICRFKYERARYPYESLPCWFFQWIDGPEKFDPRIRLFPYESQKLVPYHEFRRWVAPPPNPPPMTVDERMAAARRRDGWPVCQFNEYVQGPRSVWPSDEKVRAYEAGQAPWPCTKYPEKRCKCGIWPSVVWFPQSLVMDGIAAIETLFGKRYCLRRRAGHVIGNGSVVVMSLLLGSDVWVNETKKEKLENWGTR